MGVRESPGTLPVSYRSHPTMSRVVLRPGHVRPVFCGHPWVFKQAISQVEGGPGEGDEVTVTDPQGRVLGRGFYSPSSAIPVRLLTQTDRPIDGVLLRSLIERSIHLRRDLDLPNLHTTAFRAIHGEGDGLPGLIVDVFGEVVALQLNTHGMRKREGLIFDAIRHTLAPRAVLDRTSESASRVEGVPAGAGIVRGDETVSHLEFLERGLKYRVPLQLGQKTGFYLDQRNLRARVEALSRGKRNVLDAYTFVGAFAASAARGGARRVVAIDQSALACEVAAEVVRANGFAETVSVMKEDAITFMDRVRGEDRFDLVLCDPPKLAPSKAKHDAALVAYRRLCAAAARATVPDGIVVVSSCSSAVGFAELTRALSLGAREANVRATILEQHIQAPDHPVPAAFPEGLYLKSLVARISKLEA